jgi:hypothetical protein
MKTNFTQRKFYIVYLILVIAIFFSRKSFAQVPAGSATNFDIGGNVKSDYKLNGSLTAVGHYVHFNAPVIGENSISGDMTCFNARTDNNSKIIMNWITEVELNKPYYTIERSGDGKNFVAIGMVLGSMCSSVRKTYEYKDNLKKVDVNQTIYYRVKQSDADGKSTYSQVLSVRLS